MADLEVEGGERTAGRDVDFNGGDHTGCKNQQEKRECMIDEVHSSWLYLRYLRSFDSFQWRTIDQLHAVERPILELEAEKWNSEKMHGDCT